MLLALVSLEPTDSTKSVPALFYRNEANAGICEVLNIRGGRTESILNF